MGETSRGLEKIAKKMVDDAIEVSLWENGEIYKIFRNVVFKTESGLQIKVKSHKENSFLSFKINSINKKYNDDNPPSVDEIEEVFEWLCAIETINEFSKFPLTRIIIYFENEKNIKKSYKTIKNNSCYGDEKEFLIELKKESNYLVKKLKKDGVNLYPLDVKSIKINGVIVRINVDGILNLPLVSKAVSQKNYKNTIYKGLCKNTDILNYLNKGGVVEVNNLGTGKTIFLHESSCGLRKG